MKRVLTMTLNPCMDRTIYFSKFQQGATNYVDKIMEEAAGKGINTAIALAHVGVPVKAIGFAYEEDKKCLYEKLEAEQVPYAFVERSGRMRVNQKLFDKSTCEMTECNERGQNVSNTDVEKLFALLEKELDEAVILVLSGSVPPGVESDIYGRMIRMAKERKVMTVLDASGKLLLEGCKEKPDLIKPNKDEFMGAFLCGEDTKAKKVIVGTTEQNDMCETVMEEKCENQDVKPETIGEMQEIQMKQKAAELVESGISYVCVSLGEEGLLLADEHGVRRYPAIPAKVMSLQGAGDAMVAGFCKAIYEKEETKMAEYALKLAHSTISLQGTMMGTIE